MSTTCSTYITAIALGIPLLSLPGDGAAASYDTDELKVGPVGVHPRLGAAITYDDNVFISSSGQEGDFYATISPGVQLVYGNRDRNNISLDYTANVQRFFRLTSQDAVDHLARLDGGFDFDKLRLAVGHGFTRTSGGLTRDVSGVPAEQLGERFPGTRVVTQQNATTLSAEYDYSTKTSLGLNYSQNLTEYPSSPDLIGYQEYRVGVPVYYHVSSKTDVFGEINGGIVNVTQGANATYEEFNVGVRNRITGKISSSVKVGYQHREFEGDLDSLDIPVASASVAAALTRHTSLALGLTRDATPSAVASDTTYTRTRVDLAVRHALRRDKITLSAGGAYERDDYEQPVGGGALQYDYWEANLSCDYRIQKWWQAGAAYRFRSNAATRPGLAFDNNLVTIYSRLTF